MDEEPRGRQSAIEEAAALFRMIGPENTVESLRELIAMPPKSRESGFTVGNLWIAFQLIDRADIFR